MPRAWSAAAARGSTRATSRPTDAVLVERLRHAGALGIGKTNVPEFGLGSHTYNEVYGTTRNPYDLTKSAGGSSGGAGAALAAGMLPIADGSDLGGSLRNPANFNNVVALRPSVGLVPTAPDPFPRLGFGVNGPMARSVADVAFLLGVMAGPDPRDPGCERSDPALLRGDLARDLRGLRVAWAPDLGGLPLDARVRAVLDARRATFEALGCIVEDTCPDLTAADDIFLTIRRWRTAAVYGPLLSQQRALMKPELVEEIEAGAALRGADVAAAMLRHGQLMERVRRFFDHHAVLLCAVNQVPPFDADLCLAVVGRGRADGALRGVDALGVLDQRHLRAGALGAGGVHARRAARRAADRRPLPRRLDRAAGRPRLRAGHRRGRTTSWHIDVGAGFSRPGRLKAAPTYARPSVSRRRGGVPRTGASGRSPRPTPAAAPRRGSAPTGGGWRS